MHDELVGSKVFEEIVEFMAAKQGASLLSQEIVKQENTVDCAAYGAEVKRC